MKKQVARLFMGLMAFALFMGTATAEMPKTVNLQSVVYDPDGNVTTANSVSVSVRVVDELGNIFFQEDHDDVPVVKGAMNLVIGESSGGIPADALDPTQGRRFMDVLVNGTNPFDILPLSAVPYALWADKAVSVAKDGVTASSIKDGSIEPRHLAKDFDISKVSGVMTDAQVPATIMRQETFNLHTSSTTAHDAAAITNTAFPVQLGGSVQVALETLYNNYAQEVANRIASVNSLTTTVNGISSQVTSNRADFDDLVGDKGRIKVLESKVNEDHEPRIKKLEGNALPISQELVFGSGVVRSNGSTLFSYPTGASSSSTCSGCLNPTYHVDFVSAAADDNVVVMVTAINASSVTPPTTGVVLVHKVQNFNRYGFDVACYGPVNGNNAAPCGFHWIAIASH